MKAYRITLKGAKGVFNLEAETRSEAESIINAAFCIHKQYAPCKIIQASLDMYIEDTTEGDEWQNQCRLLYLPKPRYCDYKYCDKESLAAERITVCDTQDNRMIRYICARHIEKTVEDPLWLFGRNGEMHYSSHERVKILY